MQEVGQQLFHDLGLVNWNEVVGTDEAQPDRVSPGQTVVVIAIPVIAITPWQGSHTTALRVASTRAFGGARGGPDGFPVGVGVIEVDRDSRRIHRLCRCHAPRRGNFGVAASGSRRGRLGRPPGSAETAEQRR